MNRKEIPNRRFRTLAIIEPRLAERDRRKAADTRTQGERLLGDREPACA